MIWAAVFIVHNALAHGHAPRPLISSFLTEMSCRNTRNEFIPQLEGMSLKYMSFERPDAVFTDTRPHKLRHIRRHELAVVHVEGFDAVDGTGKFQIFFMRHCRILTCCA